MVEAVHRIGEHRATTRRHCIAVHSSWCVENEVHRVLGVTFREDDSRIPPGNAVENFGVQRHIALNLLMRETSAKRCLRAKRMKSACDGTLSARDATGQMPSPQPY